MDMLPLMLADDDIVKIAMIGGVMIAITGMIGGFIRATNRERGRSTTQREIAAYVAEGSMTSEEGERLMRAANEPTKSEES